MGSDSEGHDSVPNDVSQQGSQGTPTTAVGQMPSQNSESRSATRWNDNLKRFSQQERLIAELAVELRRNVDGIAVHEVYLQFPPTMDLADMVPATASWGSAACRGPGEGAFLVITGNEPATVIFKGVVKSAKRASMLRRYWGRLTAVTPAPIKTTMVERDDIRDRLPCVIVSALGEPAPTGMDTSDRIFAIGNLLGPHRRFSGSEAMHPGLDLSAFIPKTTTPPSTTTTSNTAVPATGQTDIAAGSSEATPRPERPCIDCGKPIGNRGHAAKRCLPCATALDERKKAESLRRKLGGSPGGPDTGEGAGSRIP